MPFQCEKCEKVFYKQNKYVKSVIKHKLNKFRFCSTICSGLSQINSITLKCVQCTNTFVRWPSQIKLSKSGNHFCSLTCAGIYNNAHKTHGTRRSKLEIWLEDQLKITYPNLIILYNNKETINSELDIYIPSLKLAVELNGIFHYEPIFGFDKLSSIQNNDDRKFQACLEQKIELLILDTSALKKFKLENAKRYWLIINSIIDQKLGLSDRA